MFKLQTYTVESVTSGHSDMVCDQIPDLDIEVLPPGPEDGVTVALYEPNAFFAPGNVCRYLAERASIHAPHFAVFINGERVTREITEGKRLPILTRTPHGEKERILIVVPPGRVPDESGIAVRVRGVLVRRETFGFNTSRKMDAARVTGGINADFLPITSSRNDFIRDTPRVFGLLRRDEKGGAKGAEADSGRGGPTSANPQTSSALKDVLQRIGRAMQRNREFFPEARVPMGETASDREETSARCFEVSKAEFMETGEGPDGEIGEKLEGARRGKKKNRGRLQVALGDKSVVRCFRLANFDIAVRAEHPGDQNESLVSGGVIYVNLNHPLYRANRDDNKLLTIHLARVITKELALETGVGDARRAFEIQSDLITDALK